MNSSLCYPRYLQTIKLNLEMTEIAYDLLLAVGRMSDAIFGIIVCFMFTDYHYLPHGFNIMGRLIWFFTTRSYWE